MEDIDESISTLPSGFKCAGIVSGIKSNGNKDLGMILAEKNAILGAVYTRNKFPSAHVEYCRKLTPSAQFRALIVNSGNANAGTGKKGEQNNRLLAEKVAESLQVHSDQIFTSSTGVIGQQLPVLSIIDHIPELISELKNDAAPISEAILTTDTKTKKATQILNIGDDSFRIFGFAKGSGMIHPNMGTMLAYILTDAPIAETEIQHIVAKVTEFSFHRITVDGDTSTNDSFFLVSSNAAASDLSTESKSAIYLGIERVAISLARQIARDGEGAEHLIELKINGVPTEEDATCLLRKILSSNLVKTAINGKDPNWGRILCALGNGLNERNLPENPLVDIRIQSIPVISRGVPMDFNANLLSKKMDAFDIRIEIDLSLGTVSATGWSCDLSHDYISINADYTT